MGENEARGSSSTDQWTACLRRELSGRRVVVVGHLATAAGLARDVVTFGATDVMLVGYGSAPAGWEGRTVTVPRPAGGVRDLPPAVAELPSDDRGSIDSFDKAGDALVLGPSFEPRMLWGRRYVGHKRPSWEALENKATVDELWDAVGVERAPSLVVPTTPAELRVASAQVDVGAGTVWSGDTARGRADGAELVFWVRSESQATLAAAALNRRCDRVRVMPYLRGVPCSIHAMVGSDGVAVFRPVENVTFCRPDGRFLWAGTDTWWDPPAHRREEMRRFARLVATHIAEEVGYRGPVGIDGAMTETGFLPTELNARWAYGMEPQAMVSPVPLRLVAGFVSSGLDGPMDALEELVIRASDSKRWGGPTLSDQTAACLGAMPLQLERAAQRRGHATSGKLWVKDSSASATVMVRPGRATGVGRSLLSLGVAGFALADEHFGTEIGPLSSPDD